MILFWIHDEFIDLLIEKAEARPPDLPARDALREMMADVLGLMETHRGHVRVKSFADLLFNGLRRER